MYQDVCATFIIDPADASESARIESLGMKVILCPTVMQALEDKERLARQVLHVFAGQAAGVGG
jgi:2-phospho-L-lactate transferase/gluconeogenesis factor (CofD/UPF0052 family)